MTSENLRLAIDIGGTFTDTVLADQAGSILASAKTLTTHADPGAGAEEGALRVCAQAGVALSDVTGMVHGTTLATNALIERRGARVATLGTDGFRDILEIAYERRYAQYDINLTKPEPLVPRRRSFTVEERTDVTGQILVPLTDSAIDTVLGTIAEARIDALAICLIHSYANPKHEEKLKAVIAKTFPDLAVSISSEISPEAREYDRLCTTLANAYIQPLMDDYLARFEARFLASGLKCPILMMTASGGMCTLDQARHFPIRLVESGPAGGAILAARVARQIEARDVLSFDMGGTTAKLCLIDDARPQTARSFEIARAARFIKGSGMPVRIPVIEMIEIGAGGGSIASLDRLQRLAVGPESAGSEPGPVAFGKGGERPTVTDADLTLGYIRPEIFAEGHLRLSSELAARAIAHDIGVPLGLNQANAAEGISQIVDENMASAARMHAVESGSDLGVRTMIAFGGNGPLHATRVARAAGVRRIVIPRDPGVGSAVGFLFAPVSFELVQSFYQRLGALDFQALNKLLRDMESRASLVVDHGARQKERTLRRVAFMRYAGQGHEIEIELPNDDLTHADLPRLVDAFETTYRSHFSRPVPGMDIEILNWAVSVSAPTNDPVNTPFEAATQTRGAGQSVEIVCDVTGQRKSALCIPRADLGPGDHVTGPALITEAQTTTLLSADFEAEVDRFGNLVLLRQTAEDA